MLVEFSRALSYACYKKEYNICEDEKDEIMKLLHIQFGSSRKSVLGSGYSSLHEFTRGQFRLL